MTDLGRRIDAAQERWERRTGKPFPWHIFFDDQVHVATHIELRDRRGQTMRTCPARPFQKVHVAGPRSLDIHSIALIWEGGKSDIDPRRVRLCPGDTLDMTWTVDLIRERPGPWGTPIKEKVGCATHPTA